MKSKEWLSQDEFNKIVNQPNITEKEESLITIMYDCALRVGDIKTLKVNQIDFEQKQIKLWSGKKTRKTHTVPLDDHTLKLLTRYIRNQNLTSDDFLFYGYKKKPYSTPGIFYIIRRLAKNANIKKVLGTHCLRRSRATHLFNSGLGIVEVSRFLRHKDLAATGDYLNISTENLRKEIQEKAPLSKILQK